MLFIVLILVLAALGLLVTALITASQTWAWVSIALSLLAAVVLVLDWFRRRRQERVPEADEEAPEEVTADEIAADQTSSEGAGTESETTMVVPVSTDEQGVDELAESEQQATTGSMPAVVAGDLGSIDDAAGGTPTEDEPTESERTAVSEPVAATAAYDDEDADPGEEDTDAADLLIVCDLDDQVVVVDEHPRYHLASCGWVNDRDPIPIAVAEARELGFTPCSLCGPDSALASKHRRRSSARR